MASWVIHNLITRTFKVPLIDLLLSTETKANQKTISLFGTIITSMLSDQDKTNLTQISRRTANMRYRYAWAINCYNLVPSIPLSFCGKFKIEDLKLSKENRSIVTVCATNFAKKSILSPVYTVLSSLGCVFAICIPISAEMNDVICAEHKYSPHRGGYKVGGVTEEQRAEACQLTVHLYCVDSKNIVCAPLAVESIKSILCLAGFFAGTCKDTFCSRATNSPIKIGSKLKTIVVQPKPQSSSMSRTS